MQKLGLKIIPSWFILVSVIFIVHQIAQKWLSLNILLIDNYLDPFLCTPILLHVYALEKHYLKKNSQTITMKEVLTITCFICIISEGVFPWLSDKFYRDYWDVFFIILGMLFYLGITAAYKKTTCH